MGEGRDLRHSEPGMGRPTGPGDVGGVRQVQDTGRSLEEDTRPQPAAWALWGNKWRTTPINGGHAGAAMSSSSWPLLRRRNKSLSRDHDTPEARLCW